MATMTLDTVALDVTSETLREASERASAVPGDSLRVLTRDVGPLRAGTQYRPLSAGQNNVTGRYEMRVTVIKPGPAAWRAYDTVTGWMGEARDSRDRAERDASRHNRGCVAQGGYGSAIVVTPDPDDAELCVAADTGETVWPARGRDCGAVRWL